MDTDVYAHVYVYTYIYILCFYTYVGVFLSSRIHVRALNACMPIRVCALDTRSQRVRMLIRGTQSRGVRLVAHVTQSARCKS
jgi:hypothetical protein